MSIQNIQDLHLKHYDVTIDTDNILWVYMNVADKSENVLDTEVLSELKTLLQAVAQTQGLAGLGLLSAKNNFIMGADVNAFAHLEDTQQITALLDHAHCVLDSLDTLKIPTGCGINGFCLGGGLEVALACKYRVVLNDDAHKYKGSIGFPEVKLGIYPGFGGTFRSIAQLGPIDAMTMMLSGKNLKPSAARRVGIAHKLVDSRKQLRWVLRKAILQGTIKKTTGKKPTIKKPKASFIKSLPNMYVLRGIVYNRMKKQVTKKADPKHYPAPHRLLDLWKQAGGNSKKMQQLEKTHFAEMMLTPTARNLQRVYYISNAMKALAKGAGKATTFSHVHIVGAGTMGLDIAMHCALKGYMVTLQDINADLLNASVDKAKGFFKKRLKTPLLVDRALSRFKTDADGVRVKTADVVIEAVVENLDVKADIFQHLEQNAPAHAILATNTSAIPLENIAENMRDKHRLIGLHFFNPAHTLPLVEVVKSDLVDPTWVYRGAKFAKDIGKFPLIVKSHPGFLVNRVLAPYIMKALELEQNGTYDKEVLDYACRQFGMPMGPVELADTVGLDIMHSVAQELGLPIADGSKIKTLLDAGKLGRKTGSGYYTWQGGRAVKTRDIAKNIDSMAIAHTVLSPLWQEAQRCLDEKIVFEKDMQTSADLIDGGIIFGTGFAPHLGGALRYAQTLGQK